MAERTMREMRDEIALHVYYAIIEEVLHLREALSTEMFKVWADASLEAAETFLAKRYDADNKPRFGR